MKKLTIVLTFLLGLQFAEAGARRASETDVADARDRDRYVEVVENKINTWDQMIDRVRKGTYGDQDFRRTVSPEEARQLADELARHRERVSNLLGQLKNTEGNEWKGFQERIQAELASMREEFRRTAE